MSDRIFKTAYVRFLMTAILSAACCIISFSQNGSIFKLSSETVSTLDGSQFSKYQKLSASDAYTTHLLIEVENLIEKQSGGKIEIALPGFQCSNLVFSASNVEYTDADNYYWYGEITTESDETCSEGTLTLMAKNGEKFGHATIDSIVYEFSDLGGGVQLLSQVDDIKFAETECAIDEQTPDYSSQSDTAGRILPCVGQCDVRVFVHFTQAAMNAEANINNRIALAIAQTNQALLNSNVLPQNARVILAGSGLLAGFVETNIMGNDVATYAARADVQATRNNLQADLMLLLTNGNYGGVFGIVQAIGPNFATSYAISQTGAATSGRFTFAHELAHLFGARHNDDPNGTFEHGHIFKTGWFIFKKKRYTIMARLDANKSRIQNYSNPNVFYLNEPTGVAGTRDNARQLRNTGCQVGNFFVNPNPPLSGSITGPGTVCACENITFEANVSCGTQPYNFQWSYSYDGIAYLSAGSNSMFYTHTMPCGGAMIDYVFIRVTITDNLGNVVSLVRIVRVIYPTSRLPMPCELPRVSPTTNAEIDQVIKPIEINLVPNPAQSTVQIEIEIVESGQVVAELTTLYGQKLRTIYRGKSEAGKLKFSTNISNLRPGSYYVRVNAGNKVSSKILIVSR